MKSYAKFLLLFLGAALPSFALTPTHVGTGQAYTTAAGQVVTASLPSTNAGDEYAIVIVCDKTPVSTPSPCYTDVHSSANNPLIPLQAASQGGLNTNGQQLMLYYAGSIKGGADAVSVTAGDVEWLAVIVAEYNVGAHYALESYPIPVMSYNVASITTRTATAAAANSQSIVFGETSHCAASSFAASGFTPEVAVTGSNGSGTSYSLGLIDETNSAAGSFTPTVSASGCNIDMAAIMTFRAVDPTFGAVDRSFWSTGTVATTDMYISPLAAGDTLQLDLSALGDTDITDACIPVIVTEQGDAMKMIPSSYHSADGSSSRDIYYLPNVSGGQTGVHISTLGTCSQQYAGVLTTIRGVGNSTPIYLSAIGNLSTTPIALPSGTAYLYSSITDSAAGNSYTPSSGWTGTPWPIIINRQPITPPVSFREVFDQVVSGGSSYQNSITVAGTPGTLLQFLVAYTAANNTPSHPVPVQSTNAGCFYNSCTSITKTIGVPATAGNTIWITAALGAAASATLTFNPPLSFTPVLSGPYFGAWVARDAAAQQYQITLTPSSSANAEMHILELTPVGNIDVSNSNSGTGTTLSTGSITTTQPDELIISNLLYGDGSPCDSSITYGGSGWNELIGAGAHCSAQITATQYATSIGTFSNTVNSPTSISLGGMIFGLESPSVAPPAPTSNVQSSGDVLFQGNVDLR